MAGVFRSTGLDSVWSGFTGKGTSEDREDAAEAALDATKFATGMSKDYYGKTAGIREGLLGRLENFVKGNFDPTESSMYGPMKMSTERQYDTARDQVISDTPAGGALFDNLGNLGAQKAGSLSSMINTIIQDEYNKAFAMGQGSQQVAASGITGAANAGAAQMNAMANQSSAGAQGMGNFVNWLNQYQNNQQKAQQSEDDEDQSILQGLFS